MIAIVTEKFLRTIVASGVLVLSSGALAKPIYLDCKDLIDKSNKTGSIPNVSIDLEWGIVRISTEEHYCREPEEIWRRRGLLWPVNEVRGTEAPRFLASPKNKVFGPVVEEAAPVNPSPPIFDLGSELKPNFKPKLGMPAQLNEPIPKLRSQIKKAGPGPEAQPCDLKIEEIWSAGYHRFNDIDYLLSEIFTIDGNGDGITDNLEFTLEAHDRSRLTVRKFQPGGLRKVSELPSLDLISDDDVVMVCRDRVSFTIPFKKAGRISIAPGLTGTARSRILSRSDGKTGSVGSKASREQSGTIDLGVLLGVSVVTLGIFIAFLFYLRQVPGGRKVIADESD